MHREDPVDLEAELAAARRTIDALTRRVEVLDGNPTDETDAMAQALAGIQRELARRTRTLEETEATYRALYESTPDPLLTVDGTGVVTACNRTALEWLRLDVAGVVGHPLSDLFHADEAALVDQLVADGFTGVLDRRFTLADGHRIGMNAAAVDGTSRQQFHVTIRDVTAREAIETAEDEQRRALALTELAGALARELNDPMSVVQGRIELLLAIGEMSPDAVQRHLTVALSHARRISATLHNLRLVGRNSLSYVGRVFLVDVFVDAFQLVGTRLAVVPTPQLDPPDLAAAGESATCARLFATLIDWVLDTCGRGARLEISGRVRGEGVVVRLHAGRPGGRRAEAATDDAQEGLQLIIARTLVSALGGRLEARSAPGSALVTVVLPLDSARRARARPMEGTVLVVGGAGLSDSVSLLVDGEGLEVIAVPDAEVALEHLRDGGAVEGVTAELLLPGLSGVSFAAEVVRRHPGLAGRVCVVSETPIATTPRGVTALRAPLRRAELLAALGRGTRGGR